MTAINRWGYIPDVRSDADWRIEDHVQLDASIPAKGSNRLDFIKDQGAHGSCTGFGVTRAMRTALVHAGLPDVDLSELFAYHQNRIESGLSPAVDTGATIRGSMDAARKWGVCVEGYWDYRHADAYLNVKPEAYAYAEALNHQALETYSVPNSPDAIRQALAAGFGVSLGVTVYHNAFENAPNGDVQMPQAGDWIPGAHNIVLDGWDDGMGRYGFPNSWSQRWGASGYGTLPYDYVSRFGADIWVCKFVESPVQPGPVVNHIAQVNRDNGGSIRTEFATAVTVDNRQVWP